MTVDSRCARSLNALGARYYNRSVQRMVILTCADGAQELSSAASVHSLHPVVAEIARACSYNSVFRYCVLQHRYRLGCPNLASPVLAAPVRLTSSECLPAPGAFSGLLPAGEGRLPHAAEPDDPQLPAPVRGTGAPGGCLGFAGWWSRK